MLLDFTLSTAETDSCNVLMLMFPVKIIEGNWAVAIE